MKTVMIMMLLLMPIAVAASDCKVVEQAQHYEVVCVGAPQAPTSQQPQEPAVETPPPTNPQTGRQHRPPPAEMEAARSARQHAIEEARQQ